jgi:hypothetical protein
LPWRELLQCTSTDRQLLLRQIRFLFLVVPLMGSVLLGWAWIFRFWEDVWRNGYGPLLYEGTQLGEMDGVPPSHAFAWVHSVGARLLEAVGLAGNSSVLARGGAWFASFQGCLRPAAWLAEDEEAAMAAAAEAAEAAEAEAGFSPVAHPAGISQKWSLLYVWLQYTQWYKVLCWLLVMVLGGSEGLLPTAAREVFRIEELLLASDRRAQVFIFWQCCPFVLTKLRHFLVTWLGASYLVRLLFYSCFTSHVEAAFTLTCDTYVGATLLHDWLSSMGGDFQLRLNLNRLRAGFFGFESAPKPKPRPGAASGQPSQAGGTSAAESPRRAAAAAVINSGFRLHTARKAKKEHAD